MTAEHDTLASSATPLVSAPYCDRCGEPAGTGTHERCDAARALEPPRYCPTCRRRLVVQVVPTGWTARCAEHGVSTSPN
ncbi:hypothetical protein [Pseudofrankia inefficax]|uniref:Biotin synthase auxiliary protein n=1 Tax=Pseudofrankia inefficax (strain DSM 45817 / CECT 9037 / DDB 130130 / EuI1c) TaxID=298654 RepID=E3IUZ7_PSEI1|nr:hypothetical protein [Pseudofrankia inefficax]ADP78877.1 hypothetical protein FraEuI1c_0799 [Pseudofrankia inefficax]